MKKVSLLIAEDDEFLRKAIVHKFTNEGFEVIQAEDGLKAIALLKTKKPDVAIVDLLLPGADGWTILETIKKNPKLKEIPVIMATNMSQGGDREKAMKLGAAALVVKRDTPLQALVQKVREALKK